MTKGYKMSQQTRLRMSQAKLGKPRHINNLGNTGHLYTEASKLKMSLSTAGVNHPNWKGGVNNLNNRIRQLSKYRVWRYNVYYRDKWTCQGCGQKGCKLEPHHIVSLASIIDKYGIRSISDALNCAFIWDTNNGISLCENCHCKTDNFRNRKP